MILPEPAHDAAAQMAAVADPRNPKDTAFFASGTRVPSVPQHLHAVTRPEGTLVTSDRQKALAFRQAPALHDALMARLLDYPESKSQAAASGKPHVVQGLTPGGAVVHEMAASPAGIPAAVRQAGAVAPNVRVTTPAHALGRRVGILGI